MKEIISKSVELTVITANDEDNVIKEKT